MGAIATVDFLQVCLLPLHTPSMVNMYHQQLSYCVVQYVEKEVETATHILKVGINGYLGRFLVFTPCILLLLLLSGR